MLGRESCNISLICKEYVSPQFAIYHLNILRAFVLKLYENKSLLNLYLWQLHWVIWKIAFIFVGCKRFQNKSTMDVQQLIFWSFFGLKQFQNYLKL